MFLKLNTFNECRWGSLTSTRPQFIPSNHHSTIYQGIYIIEEEFVFNWRWYIILLYNFFFLSSKIEKPSLEDPFRPKEDTEDSLGPKVSYLSAIGALVYLANYIRPSITFAINLIARFSVSPTRKHWNDIKHIFRYLQISQDLGILHTRNQDMTLVDYSNGDYMYDPYIARS